MTFRKLTREEADRAGLVCVTCGEPAGDHAGDSCPRSYGISSGFVTREEYARRKAPPAWMQAAIRAALAPKLEELAKFIKDRNAEGGAWAIVKFCQDYPIASSLIESLFQGTAKEVKDRAHHYWPDVYDVPDSFIEGMQSILIREFERKRF